MGVVEFLCDQRFHRSLVLPPNPEASQSKPFRVSYADYGDSSSDAVVLLCGALMATRFCYSPLDELAKQCRVRIIHPDRPGVGGSDQVGQHERIAKWLEIVPRLLAQLHITHVSIASHSGGAIYALNTILTFPNLLHPTTPYVTFFAPWVHPSRSGVNSMRATELLPAPLIGRFASIVRFVNQNVIPLAGLSGAFLHGMKGSFHCSAPDPAPVPLTPTLLSLTDSNASRGALPGLDLDDPTVVEEMRQLIISYLFAENMDGISADAMLFLKKPHSIQWCSPSVFWSDIDYAVLLLRNIIDQDGRDSQYSQQSRYWIVDSFHAEKDYMIGEKGRAWFDACWASNKASLSSATDQHDNSLEYRSETVFGSEHNYLMDPLFGASAKWLWQVRGAFPRHKEKAKDVLDGTPTIAPSNTKKLARLTWLIVRARRAVHDLRSMRTKEGSPHNVYMTLDDSLGTADELSLIRARREGKVGSSVPMDTSGL